MYHLHGSINIHRIAFALHGQHRRNPLSKGLSAWPFGVELPCEPSDSRTPEHNAKDRITGTTRVDQVFWKRVFFAAVNVVNLDVPRRAAEGANWRTGRLAFRRSRAITRRPVGNCVSWLTPTRPAHG